MPQSIGIKNDALLFDIPGLDENNIEGIRELMRKVREFENNLTIELAARIFGGHYTKMSSDNFNTLMPTFGGLPGKAYLVYTFLRRFVTRKCHNRLYEDTAKFYQCGLLATSRSNRRIAKKLGLCRESVRQYIIALENAKLIKTFRYTLNPSDRRPTTLIVLGWVHEYGIEEQTYALEVWFEDVLAIKLENEATTV